MSNGSTVVLSAGFGALIVLIAALGVGTINKAGAIYEEMHAAQDSYLRTESFRRDIARDIYRADILVRDYLLDLSPSNAPENRENLLKVRESLQERLSDLGDDPRSARLQAEVKKYWDSLDPVLEWTDEQKEDRSWRFFVRQVLPNRNAVVSLASELANINDEKMERERQRLQDSQDVLRRFLIQMMTVALGLGSLVAGLTIYRVVSLEKIHDAQRKQIEESQHNLRRLSQRLVQAQEGERKELSRELHDEVGQMLTALGIQLGNLADLRKDNSAAFMSRLEDAKTLNTHAMRAIRDLAMGLRPSMLDDLGLEPALQWQGREFSRHTGVPSTVEVAGTLDDLTEAQQTCIYRVVQEALTNCARHANATSVVVGITAENGCVSVLVRDNGSGFNPKSPGRTGLGLLGIQERVQALAGKVDILSEQGKGTVVRVDIPLEAVA
jgi:signal transduction histidine kinase